MKHNTTKSRGTYPLTNNKSAVNVIRMLIVDDDPIASAVIKKQLELSFSDSLVDIKHEPVIPPGYHIYLLDNDFKGEHMAGTLVREARSIEPSSLIVALSTTLSLQEMNQMVNDGCNAVFDKQDPQQSYEAKQVMANYISVVNEASTQGVNTSVPRLISSLSQLLKQWNQRLANAG